MRLHMTLDQDDQGLYRASCHELPGCVVTAESEQEAWQRLDQAVAGYLASLNACMPYELHEADPDAIPPDRVEGLTRPEYQAT